MVNPLLIGLPAFLARTDGTESGYMIAQYAAASLIGENRQPASRTRSLYQRLRSKIPTSADDRPLGEDIAAMGRVIEEAAPAEILARLGLN